MTKDMWLVSTAKKYNYLCQLTTFILT